MPGDNVFYGQGFTSMLEKVVSRADKVCATVFGYAVSDPEHFGLVEFDRNNNVLSIEEKLIKPKSKHAVTILYFYDNNVVSAAKDVKPGMRGEPEITCVNNYYLDQNKLFVEKLGRGFAWLDTGTHESLLEAAQFVETIEKRQEYKVACLEDSALNNRWLSESQVLTRASELNKNSYGEYLRGLCDE